MNPDSPLEIIGCGFIPGIPGIYGNTVIPVPDNDANASSISPDVPTDSPQSTDTTIPPEQPKRSAKTAKAGA